MNHQDGDFYPIMQMFKAVRMLCPKKAFSLNISRESVEQLRHGRLLAEDATIHELQEELPAYLAAAQDAIIDQEHPRLAWWKAYDNLPAWQNSARAEYSMCTLCYLHQPMLTACFRYCKLVFPASNSGY